MFYLQHNVFKGFAGTNAFLTVKTLWRNLSFIKGVIILEETHYQFYCLEVGLPENVTYVMKIDTCALKLKITVNITCLVSNQMPTSK